MKSTRLAGAGTAVGLGLILAGLATPLGGQEAARGRIVGMVVDGGSGQPLSGVLVRAAGTGRETLTGVDGRYMLTGIPPGEEDLTVTNLGYAEKTVTGVRVPAGGVARVDVSLTPRALEVEGVTVAAVRERGTVASALNVQRVAVGVVSSVTAEQIARSPDGDAAAAIRRVSGVSVQDGRYVAVRGLGERYTTTSLNGARIPSPEPERRTVPLDLFPAGLLSSITTSKTFTPDQPGDFSGGQVDLRTRDFPARNTASVSVSSGWTPGVTGAELPGPPAAGGEWAALGAAERALPRALDGVDFSTATRGDMTRMVESFRNAWAPEAAMPAPAGSFGVSAGGTDVVLGREVGYVASGSYSLGREARLGEVRATTLADVDGSAAEASRFAGTSGTTSVLWGGLLNVSANLTESHRLSFQNTYNRTADNTARRELGSTENLGGLPLHIDRLRYVERAVRSNQVRGQHQLGDAHLVEWTAATSSVARREPDRSEIVYIQEVDPSTGTLMAPAWFGGSNEAAVRTFGSLEEGAREVTGRYRLRLGGLARPVDVTFGGLARWVERDASNQAYSISAPGTLSREQRQIAPERLFDGRYSELDPFTVQPLGQGGSYEAEDGLFAGFGMVALALGERVQVVGGARVERSDVRVRSVSTNGEEAEAAPSYTDVLPSLAVNVDLTDDQRLRLAASRTLARPEYREMAPILYREVIGAENIFGNAALERTLITNLDARWEWYPGPGEVLSVAAFAKRFQDPIEQVYVAASGTALLTYVNAEGAENYGVEVEARKGLGFLASSLEPVWVFANGTVMRSEIRIGSAVASKTRDERTMVGQAPYVANAGVTYAARDDRLSATVLYNVVGERIIRAAEAPLPDVRERPRPALDASFRWELFQGLTAELDGKNLLDSPYQALQGDVVRSSYRTGRSFSLGFGWRLY